MDIDNASIEAGMKHATFDLMDHLAALVEEDAKLYVHVKTGVLQASIRRAVNGGTFRVGSDLERSVYLEEGTAAHVIRPRNGRALMWEGADHPYALVHHPGTAPAPFLRPALWKKREA